MINFEIQQKLSFFMVVFCYICIALHATSSMIPRFFFFLGLRLCLPAQPHWSWMLSHGHFTPSPDSSMAFVSYKIKYMCLVQINPEGCLSLPRNSVSRLTDQLNMNLIGWYGHKTQNTNKQCPKVTGRPDIRILLPVYAVNEQDVASCMKCMA